MFGNLLDLLKHGCPVFSKRKYNYISLVKRAHMEMFEQYRSKWFMVIMYKTNCYTKIASFFQMTADNDDFIYDSSK